MVDLANVILFFVTDEATKAICIFAESIRNAVAFAKAAREAAAARKRIVMLISLRGRTDCDGRPAPYWRVVRRR